MPFITLIAARWMTAAVHAALEGAPAMVPVIEGNLMKALKLLATAAAAVGLLAGAAQAQTADGTAANPYRVMLVPADG
ncbi:MAG: hypothetical protein KJ587_10270, partial [Alphaproteobacteria bacterium]|nr:hypothetical protein [Alphaproteobacteria bacterium]